MNALIYTESGKLIIRKPNGLEWEYENVDQPELGFDYEVLVYDDIEVKILKWNDEIRDFEGQEKSILTDEDKRSIELYIENSEPPLGYNLNTQYVNRLEQTIAGYTQATSELYGMIDLYYATYAGREGSNHPRRADARRVLEYCDTAYSCFSQIAQEIMSTREDTLKHYDDYLSTIPEPLVLPDSRTG
tara:strand:+ start:27 stop:590 length:564 start_codon:yes stop_codon:yes gene_type:complete